MLNGKKGASIISLALAAVALTLTTTALVIATNNSAMYRYEKAKRQQVKEIDRVAYVKVYTLDEVKSVARQAYVDNYLSFYEKEVDLQGLEALVIGEMMEHIPQNQLDKYSIIVTDDSINVAMK